MAPSLGLIRRRATTIRTLCRQGARSILPRSGCPGRLLRTTNASLKVPGGQWRAEVTRLWISASSVCWLGGSGRTAPPVPNYSGIGFGPISTWAGAWVLPGLEVAHDGDGACDLPHPPQRMPRPCLHVRDDVGTLLPLRVLIHPGSPGPQPAAALPRESLVRQQNGCFRLPGEEFRAGPVPCFPRHPTAYAKQVPKGSKRQVLHEGICSAIEFEDSQWPDVG